MSVPLPPEPPLRIERVASAPIDAETVLLSLSGWWTEPVHATAGDELLVVEVRGRRYRYVARSPDGDGSPAVAAPRSWAAGFEIPVWAQPRAAGQAYLWLGNLMIDVPVVGGDAGPGSGYQAGTEADSASRPGPAEPSSSAPPRGVGPGAQPVRAPAPPSPHVGGEDSRSGPLAELLLRETVAALRSELRERATELAQLRGALADARSGLDAGAATRDQMETAHAELRAELEQLTGLVEHEGVLRAELERVSDAERRAAARQLEDSESRADELQRLASGRADEVEQLTSERDSALQQLKTLGAGIQREAEARDELERRTRGLIADLSHAHAQLAAATASRDGALSEASELRRELDRLGGELSAARAQLGDRSVELGQARALLADARALSARLRERRSEPSAPSAPVAPAEPPQPAAEPPS